MPPSDDDLLAAIDGAIAGNPDGIKTYWFHGRKVERMSLTELMQVRAMILGRKIRCDNGGMFRVGRCGTPGGDMPIEGQDEF